MSEYAKLLDAFGLPEREMFETEPYKCDDGIWRVKITHQGDPALLMGIAHAAKLADAIRISNGEFANQLDKSVEKARRSSQDQ